MGGEAFLMGLGGCFMSNLLAAIGARKANVTEVKVEIRATLEDGPPHFSAIQMAIAAKGGDRSQLKKLVTIAERGCIVANTIKPAVKLTFTAR
jgi:putative redox protein